MQNLGYMCAVLWHSDTSSSSANRQLDGINYNPKNSSQMVSYRPPQTFKTSFLFSHNTQSIGRVNEYPMHYTYIILEIPDTLSQRWHIWFWLTICRKIQWKVALLLTCSIALMNWGSSHWCPDLMVEFSHFQTLHSYNCWGLHSAYTL